MFGFKALTQIFRADKNSKSIPIRRIPCSTLYAMAEAEPEGVLKNGNQNVPLDCELSSDTDQD